MRKYEFVRGKSLRLLESRSIECWEQFDDKLCIGCKIWGRHIDEREEGEKGVRGE